MRRPLIVAAMIAVWYADIRMAAANPPLIGYLYRIEGFLDGEKVIYIGSAASIKERFASEYKWEYLLEKKSTKVYVKKVYGRLKIESTLDKARRQALRSVEQPVIDRARRKVAQENHERTQGQARAKVLNKDRAAKKPAKWRAKHQVKVARRWVQIKKVGGPLTLRAAGGVFLLLDVYRMYRETKTSRFDMAPYVLEDERGAFTIEYRRSSQLKPMKYFKKYVTGEAKGREVPISKVRFWQLKAEAEALWGTTDWKGDFVPGLLQRTLPVTNKS